MVALLSALVRVIADFLVQALRAIHGLTGSYGTAIILLTLGIKLVLHPLTRKSLKSMKAMQALAPQMAVLREKYREDPRAMNVEMMNLYRAHNVSPFSGCLPQLVQLPVLYALFAALRRQLVFVPPLHLAGATLRMLPPADVSSIFQAETFLGMPLDITPTPGTILGHPLLAIFPLLVGLTTYFQQRMSITDPQQARMFLFMPIMVAYFATNFQIGLSIYWIVSTLAYVLEYLIVVGRPKPVPAGGPPAPKATPAVLPQRPKGTKKR